MADFDLPSVMQALRAADASGNTEDATRLAQIAQGLSAQAAPQEAPTPQPAAPADPNADKSVVGELGNSAWKSLAQVGQGFANFVDKVGPGPSTPEDAEARRQRRADTAKQYGEVMAQGPAVPTIHDVKNAHDAMLYGADKLGGVAPYIPAMAAGMVPGAAAAAIPAVASTGAVQGGEAEAEQPNSTPASVATGAALGGAMGAARVPFLQGEGGVAARMAKGALVGGPVIGAAQGATANIPRAVASGNPADASPDRDAIVESMIGNSIGMGALGGVHAGAERALGKLTGASEAPVDKAPADAANTRLADLIRTKAEENGLDLKKVNYADPAGAKVALDATHDALAEQIKPLWDVVKDATNLDPKTASNLDGLLERSGFMATMRAARNKVKGSISDADFARLDAAVGHTEEGRQLIDLTRQANQLSELFRQGLKGGVSQYTDHLNPFGHGGRETGYTSILRAVAPKALEAGAIIHNPALGVPMVAGYAGGRAIDALTGRRSTVQRFVDQNRTPATPIDMTGTRSILADRNTAQQQLAAKQLQDTQARALADAQAQVDKQQQAADTQRLLKREQELRTQNRLDNNPGLGGFDRSIYDQTGIKPADAVPGVFELFRTGRITPTEFHSFFDSPHDLMKGNAGNHIIDMLDQLARKGTVERDPEWNQGASPRPEQPQGGSIRNPAAYAAQAAGNQSRVTEAQTRVSASPHTPEVRGIINDAAAAIGRTNNRADAEHVRQSAAQALAAHSPEAVSLAHQELGPLVEQIRHPGNAPAEGMPRGSMTADETRTGNASTRTLAAAYKIKAGITKPAYEGKLEPDVNYLKQVADFHDAVEHTPGKSIVQHSYAALARETIAQFKSLGGLKVETWKGDGEPYANSKAMMRDVSENNHLWFLPTDTAFGSNGEKITHPMLAETGLKTVDGHPLLLNDVFRIVHDFYGHTQHGFQFGPVGEYNAFREHAQMYSDTAVPALAAETLAQNAWVNFGPHLRRPNGSIPRQGDADYVPAPERKFSDQKAYAVPKELLARDPNLTREFVGEVTAKPEGQIPQGLDIAKKAKPSLHDLVPGIKGISPYLTASEREGMLTRTAKLLVEKFTNLPSAKEMAAVAYSGRAKRGWYNRSANAIVSVFGQADANRFTALLAALSPQTDVETNFHNAVNVWRGWIEADRPKDQASIMRVLSDELPGAGTDMEAWVLNSMRALTAEDGAPITISGPKVSSFMQNLLGEVNEVTNDTWMANWAGIEQSQFKGASRGIKDDIGNVYTKGSGYLAMSALTRKAADILTKQTGETWTPAEVQETVWSWAKALYEKSNSKQSASSIVKEQSLTHGDIDSVPDFEKTFVNDLYGQILDLAGYGDYIDNLKYTLDERSSNAGSNVPGGTPFSAEGSGFGQGAFNKYLAASAKRLDALKSNRAADTVRAPKAADIALNDGEKIAARHYSYEAAQKLVDALKPARLAKEGEDDYSVVISPKPLPQYETAQVPPTRAFTDPQGARGAASFVVGMEHPDGTTRGLVAPEIRAVAKTIARLVEGAKGDLSQNGVYTPHNNTIQVFAGMSPSEHGRVLGHETGHAIEALAGVAKELGVVQKADPATALQLVKELSSVSRLERPHLWSDDKELEAHFDRPAKVIHEYRTRLDELFADGFRHYMVDPSSMKKVAPLAAKFMRDLVNPSKIGKVIAFTSLAGLTLPGIIAQALASLYQGGNQEDA